MRMDIYPNCRTVLNLILRSKPVSYFMLYIHVIDFFYMNIKSKSSSQDVSLLKLLVAKLKKSLVEMVLVRCKAYWNDEHHSPQSA